MMAKFNVLLLRWYFANIVLLLCSGCVSSVMAQEETCYGPGSIATSVLLTLIIGALLAVVFYYLWKRYWESRKGKHLILETDPEKGKGEFAFDNPGFKDAGLTPIPKPLEKNNKLESSNSNNKTKWNQWSPLGALTLKNEKKQTQDDSALDDQIKAVSLRSHDFTGLGFNICGNMKEGIYIKDVLHRGPASESGKLNSGDRIKSVNISFEHMVYEDALTILSYASPYEVTIFAKNGKAIHHAGHAAQPGHPIYRSSSSTDLLQIGKSAKKCLFQADESSEIGSNYSSLQKTRSTATTLERNKSKSPKPSMKLIKAPKIKLNPDQLKTQLEQKIIEDHKENLKIKNDLEKPLKIEAETQQKTDNKYHKFGIKVLPIEHKEQKSPKIAELSQNDNNINLERHQINSTIVPIVSIDEVDVKKVAPPPVKKREKINKPPPPNEKPEAPIKPEMTFERKNSLNNSGIRRDENNIPLEMPNNMYNAALAARKNRKTQEEEDAKSPKKKGKAPPPPAEEKLRFDDITTSNDNIAMTINEDKSKSMDTINISLKDDTKDYNSDSDIEVDNQSSVNTIELNSSDITVHQSEENEEKLNRKTASTGDLTKHQKTRKISTGTLERAQSLDINDTTIPTLSKKRKAGKIEDNFDSKTSSDESLYGSALINKEPRLSLILDGLNTFQRSRLKKSSEWGKLEDAILSTDKTGSSDSFDRKSSSYEDFKLSAEHLTKNFNFGAKSPEFDALVNKINEIKQETIEIINEQDHKIDDNLVKVENNLEIPKYVKLTNEEMLKSMDEVPKTIENMAKTIEEMPKTMHHEMITPKSSKIEEFSKPIHDAPTVLSTEVKKVKNQIWPMFDASNEERRNGVKNEKFEIRINSEADFKREIKPFIIEEPSKKMEVTIEPSKKIEATIEPLKKLDVRIEPLKQMEVRIEPSKKIGTTIEPLNKLDVRIELLKKMEVRVEPSNKMEVRIEPSKKIEATIEPSKKLDVRIEPLKKMEVRIEPLKKLEVAIEPLKKTEPTIEPLKKMEVIIEPLTKMEVRIEPSKKMDVRIDPLKKIEVRNEPFKKIEEPIHKPMRDALLQQIQAMKKPLEETLITETKIEVNSDQIFEEIITPEITIQIKPIDINITNDFAITPLETKVIYPKMGTKRDEKKIDNTETIQIKDKPIITQKIAKEAPINIGVVSDFILAERAASSKYIHEAPVKLDDMNISDDIKVSRHSLGSLERPKFEMKLENPILDKQNISNITITNESEEIIIPHFETCVIKPKIDNFQSKLKHVEDLKNYENVSVSTPDLIKNITIAEALHDLNNDVTIEGPSSLNFDIPAKKLESQNGFQLKTNGDYFDHAIDSDKNHSSLTYITEIQVTQPNNKNVSEIEVNSNTDKNLNQDFDKYIKDFESNIKNFENNIHTFEQDVIDVKDNTKNIIINEKVEVVREFQNVHQIAEEQLKKLPEMRFSTSSYESQLKTPEKRQSQIEILRSNFEKRASKTEISPTKSRIPVALTKTPPTSPERRDSRTLELEPNSDLIEMLSSHIPMTSSIKYQPKATTRNVTVTSIRSNSKIPSGLPTYGNRPPVPLRKSDDMHDVQVSSNGNSESSFKQWVFNPTDSSVTNINVSDTKIEHK